MVKFGFSSGNQRWLCRPCRCTRTENKPTGDLRLEPDKIIQIVHLLVEGVGIRAASRLADVHRDTVMNVLEFAGTKATQVFNQNIINVTVNSIQVDELYTFVRKKQYNCFNWEYDFGDQYTFLAIEPDTKLLLAYHVGKRDEHETKMFIRDLSLRIDKTKSLDITSDGFIPYVPCVTEEFQDCASYAQLIKNFQFIEKKERLLRNVPIVQKTILFGQRQNQSISTSYIERLNLSVRTFNRRFVRRGIGYSKKLENLKHAVALFAAHYNFCRIHSTIKTTPAVAHGIVNHIYSLQELMGF
ncbi:MAG TPA: IS1 family transposase [Verrucomicrobiae bacterium]|nr:IS1 family transposase [Verrucomicrobiae bacterium]